MREEPFQVQTKAAFSNAQNTFDASARGVSVQFKLTVGQPGDEYEQEADRMADKVMRMPEPELKLNEKRELPQNGPPAIQAAASIQRLEEPAEEEKEKKLQAKEQTGQAPQVKPNLEVRLQSRLGHGQPLPEETRAFMEPRFGRNFGQVQVHADAEAVQMNRELNAQAFTHKQDVFFGAGRYNPESSEGMRLLAHELSHVLQQSDTGEQIQREIIGLNAQRPGPNTTTGHAFVTLEDAKGKRQGYGLYAACTKCVGTALCSDADLAAILFWHVPGVVCSDTNHSADVRVNYTIGSAEYTRAKSAADSYRVNPPFYDLFSQNCVDFVRIIASKAGVAVPDFPFVDEAEELADYLQEELDRRMLSSSVLALAAMVSGDVNLNQDAPEFEIRGLPANNPFEFRWVIADQQDRRYLMWGAGGEVFEYGQDHRAYIPSRTRQLLKDRGIREATVLCRVKAGRGTRTKDRQLRLAVRFVW